MLQKLIEIGKQVLAESDINRVLTIALDGAIEITGAERGMVILFGSGDKILFETARNLKKADIENPKFEISQTIINRVKSDFKAICLHNALEDHSLKKSASAVRLKILSVICLPLQYENNTFGVVYLDNRTVRGAFEQDTFRFAQEFTDFISLAAHHALEKKRLKNHITSLGKEIRGKFQFEEIIGSHPKIMEVLKLVGQVADTDATVLLQGENGTGKELIARALHYNSSRKNKPFLPINCGALAENILESELFGHVKGAFTGAIKDKAGYFERADGGTIFFDEISEMSPSLQVKLLRVLQTGEYSPVGSTEICHCDVRIVAATNKKVEELVKDDKFREDLYYRLKVIELELPPLRERRSDIPILAGHFLKLFSKKYNRENLQISERTKAILLAHDFPGNIRELEHTIQHAVVLSEGDIIEQQHLPHNLSGKKNSLQATNRHSSLTEIKHHASEEAEDEFIRECLKTTRGHISNAAKMAGIDVSNFHKLIKKHNIDPTKFKQPQ